MHVSTIIPGTMDPHCNAFFEVNGNCITIYTKIMEGYLQMGKYHFDTEVACIVVTPHSDSLPSVRPGTSCVTAEWLKNEQTMALLRLRETFDDIAEVQSLLDISTLKALIQMLNARASVLEDRLYTKEAQIAAYKASKDE